MFHLELGLIIIFCFVLFCASWPSQLNKLELNKLALNRKETVPRQHFEKFFNLKT